MTARALPHDQVHVWQASLALPHAKVEEAERLLSPDERARAERFRLPADRARYICSRGILRRLLAQYLSAAPEEIRFRYGAQGKPELDDPWRASEIRFNLSHAADLLLVAVGRGRRVGVDLESMRDLPGAERLACRIFPAADLEAWRRLAPDERHSGFFHHWARLEAAAKLYGDGLFRMSRRRATVEAGISVWMLDAPEGCVAAVAAEGEGAAVHRFGWPA